MDAKFGLVIRICIGILLTSVFLVGCQSSSETPADCYIVYETQAGLVQSARDAKNRGDEAAFREFIDMAATLGADALSWGC